MGSDLIFCDDITNAEQARKDKQEMANAWSFFKTTLPSRVNDFSKYFICNIQQRLAVNDVTGKILSDVNLSSEYKFVVIPAQFEKDTILVCPITGTLFEYKKDEFLWPERFGDYQSLRNQVGEVVWQTQYMQHPIASDVSVVKEEMIIEKSINEVPSIDQADMIYASHDFPVKDKDTSDFLGSIVAYKVKGMLYITNCLEERKAFVESIKYVSGLSDLYPGIVHIIEDKANGSPILQQLQEEVAGLQAFQPGTASKTQRLESATVYINNVVFVKDRYDENSRTYTLSPQLKNLKNRLICYPYVDHDDVCDAFSMLILFVFMDKKLAVYGRSFNDLNMYNKDIVKTDNLYTNVFFNKEGDNWKVLEIAIDYGVDSKMYVKRELQFKAEINGAIEKLKEFSPGTKVFLDSSQSTALYGLVQDGIYIENYNPSDFDISVGNLTVAFANKKILIEESCKMTKSDIENFKFNKSKDENEMKYRTQKDGFVACIRAAVNFYGQVN